MTRQFEKKCKVCDCVFLATGPAGLYCISCQSIRIERQREYNRKKIAEVRVASGRIKKPGVGKGGNSAVGHDHHSYKHGRYTFERIRYEVKNEMKCCEQCNKDLTTATHYFWVVHHKDHNQMNNSRENLQLLCKRCHQLEHECHTAFTKGATTRE